MGTGSQTLEVSQNSINRGWRLNQPELEVKILKSVCTGFPWMCVCVCTHTTDSTRIFLLMHFRCLFLMLPWLGVTNLFPFEFIMLGPGNLPRAAWEKMKEKRRDGSPSCKEKAHFWTTCEDGKFQINHPTQVDRKTQLLGPWSLDSRHSGTSLNLTWLDW